MAIMERRGDKMDKCILIGALTFGIGFTLFGLAFFGMCIWTVLLGGLQALCGGIFGAVVSKVLG
jgi:hypothetical protein